MVSLRDETDLPNDFFSLIPEIRKPLVSSDNETGKQPTKNTKRDADG